MVMPTRLEKAITKLYKAFNNGTLDAMDTEHCAVGNICDNNNALDPEDIFPFGYERRIENTFDTGYSKQELANVEKLFINGDLKKCLFFNDISNKEVEDGYFTKKEQKELQLKGLEAVTKYLCELDGVGYESIKDLVL